MGKNDRPIRYVGIDVGGTKCAVTLADGELNILKKEKIPTVSKSETIKKLINTAAEFAFGENVVSVGVSCGGPLDEKRGIILSPPNLPGWDDVHFRDEIADALGVKTYMKNDADACAFAEWKYGAGKGCESMIFLTFGTGMGAGLILGGKLYCGASGMAGEVGHIRIEKDGPVGYGKAGSFEGFCSGGGIKRTAEAIIAEKLSRGETLPYCKSIGELSSVDAKVLSDAAKNGDKTALEIYEKCGEKLGAALSVLIDILNPETIVIGSIYARSGELMKNGMERVLKAETLPRSLAACSIVGAKLGESIGDMAALCVAKYAKEFGFEP